MAKMPKSVKCQKLLKAREDKKWKLIKTLKLLPMP